MSSSSLRPIYLVGIETAVPEFACPQNAIRDFMIDVQGDTDRKRSFLQKVYAGSAIERRHSVLPDFILPLEERTFFPRTKDLEPEPTTAQRNAVFCVESNNLAALAAERLLLRIPALKKSEITHLITVSCTGFSAPGFDYHLVKELGLEPGVHRFHLGFMGCFAAFPALKLAQSLCLSQPGSKVLIVDVELCTLHFQKTFEPDTVVANALFADGAAAVLVTDDSTLVTEEGGPRLQLSDFASRLIPGSDKEMAWIIGEHGFDMKLSSYVPRLIENNIQTILDDLFTQAGWTRNAELLWAIHPGGRAILDKTASVLGLPPEALEVSYKVLASYGNMSSVTIFFVLKALLEKGQMGPVFACAFGPGLTVESALMAVVPS
ncbi:MAG: type III polyketide synthase [Spirochaetales bacterium]|nr:type III polyketide synthase [Spirochaetales bacterium]